MQFLRKRYSVFDRDSKAGIMMGVPLKRNIEYSPRDIYIRKKPVHRKR